jgi:hypothetical protein
MRGSRLRLLSAWLVVLSGMVATPVRAAGPPPAKPGAEPQQPSDESTRKQVEELLWQLASSQADVSEDAFWDLVEVGRAALPRLRQATEGRNKELAARASKCIREIEQRPISDLILRSVVATRPLRGLLHIAKDPRPQVRAHVAAELRKYHDHPKEVAPVLLAAMRDKQGMVRYAAADSLWDYLEEPGVVDALIAALKDPDETLYGYGSTITEAAAYSLGRMGRVEAKVVSALIEVVQSARAQEGRVEGGLQDTAMRALGTLAGTDPTMAPTIVPVLTSVLRGKNMERRWLAAGALSLAGPGAKDAVPDLVEALQKNDLKDKKMSENIRGTVLYALQKIGPGAKAAVPAAIAILRDKSLHFSLRQDAAEALGSIGPAARDALPFLKAAANDPQEERGLREAARDAMEAIGSR